MAGEPGAKGSARNGKKAARREGKKNPATASLQRSANNIFFFFFWLHKNLFLGQSREKKKQPWNLDKKKAFGIQAPTNPQDVVLIFWLL